MACHGAPAAASGLQCQWVCPGCSAPNPSGAWSCAACLGHRVAGGQAQAVGGPPCATPAAASGRVGPAPTMVTPTIPLPAGPETAAPAVPTAPGALSVPGLPAVTVCATMPGIMGAMTAMAAVPAAPAPMLTVPAAPAMAAPLTATAPSLAAPEASWHCPSCKAHNAGTKFCGQCGTGKPPPAAPAPDPQATWTCTCTSLNRGSFCGGCGASRHSVTTWGCPCSAMNPGAARFCGGCGGPRACPGPQPTPAAPQVAAAPQPGPQVPALWVCYVCSTSNVSTELLCARCRSPQPAAAMGHPMLGGIHGVGGGMLGGGRGAASMRPAAGWMPEGEVLAQVRVSPTKLKFFRRFEPPSAFHPSEGLELDFLDDQTPALAVVRAAGRASLGPPRSTSDLQHLRQRLQVGLGPWEPYPPPPPPLLQELPPWV
jgi:hypothetical protein